MAFSGEHGIVIQMDNPRTDQYWSLHGFHASWASKCKEEDEILFFGGSHFIKIVSIRIRTTKQNFEKFVYCLYYLDLMLTGGWLKFMKVTEDDIFVIESLVNDILHPKKGDKPFDEYIYSTFAAFIQSKKRITFHLQELKNANKEIRDLLLNELNESNVRTDDYRSNLFKKQIFAIFKNVRSIVIQTGKDQSVSMSELLSLIELGSLDIVTVQVGCKSATWISELWKASSHTLERQYDDGNYVLSYHEDKHNYKFVIHKKHHCV
eukprot:514720_1